MVGVRRPSATLFWLLEVSVYFDPTARGHKSHQISKYHTLKETFSIDCSSQLHSGVQEFLIFVTTSCSLNEPDNNQLIHFVLSRPVYSFNI